MQDNYSYILTDNSLTVFIDGEPNTAHSSHPNWEKVVNATREKDWGAVKRLIDIEKSVEDFLGTSTEIKVENGMVLYNETPLHNALTARIVMMMGQGFDVSPMLKFLKNLMNNPSNRAINELYGFLEYGTLPITQDGHFLAYKLVDSDYKDCYSHTIDNSIGQTVELERRVVDDNPNNTCSTGLHFCSLEYLKSFWGNHLMAVKINPADVVSIPVDYNNTKGRCCKYQVVDELPMELIKGKQDAWQTPVVNDYDYEEEDYEEDYYEEEDYEKYGLEPTPADLIFDPWSQVDY